MESRMLARKVLKVVMWLLIAVIALALASFAIVYFNKDKIKAVLVEELNASLTTKIKVNKINVDFLSAFPNAALTFNDVLACDAYEGEISSDTLFFFHRLYLSFNVVDIIKGNYRIKKIVAQHGQFNMKIRKDGKENYIFWKRSDTTSNTNFHLQLKSIKLNDVTYVYRNDCTHQYYKILIKKGHANGNFYNSQQKIKLHSEAVLQNMQASNLVIATSLPITLSINCANNTNIGKIELGNSQVELNKIPLNMKGYLHYKKENFIDIALSGSEVPIKRLLSLLPQDISKTFKDYQSNGSLVFNSTVKGVIDKRNVPAIDADFKIKGGTLSNKKIGITLNQINLAGKYSNGSKRNPTTSVIDISNFSTKFCDGLIKGSLRLSDFSKLNIQTKLNANIDLANLQKLLQIKEIEQLSGNLDCDIQAKGSLKNIKNISNDIILNGNANITNLGLKIKDIDHALTKTNVRFDFSNNDIKILNLAGMLNNEPFNFTGTINNPLDFVFNNTKQLSIGGNLQLASFEYKTGKTKASDSSSFSFPNSVNIDLNLQLSNFKYDDLHLRDIKTNFKFSNSGLTLGKLSCNAFKGQISGTIGLVERAKEGYNLFGTLNLASVSISDAFKGLNNFGQTTLTDANIKGKMSANTTFNIAFDRKFNVLQDKISLSATYKISDGALHNVPILKKLSYFVEESALQDVNFATIESSLQIKDGCINFEPLKVQSNALNFEFLGKHYIKTSNIDYHFAIHLTELASKKKKAKLTKQQQEFGAFEQDANARLTLFVKVGGSIDKPIFSYDMKRNMEQVKQTLRQDKQKIASQLQNDLKINTEQARKDQKQWQQQSNGQWVIQWDDSPQDTVTSKSQKKEELDLIIEWE